MIWCRILFLFCFVLFCFVFVVHTIAVWCTARRSSSSSCVVSHNCAAWRGGLLYDIEVSHYPVFCQIVLYCAVLCSIASSALYVVIMCRVTRQIFPALNCNKTVSCDWCLIKKDTLKMWNLISEIEFLLSSTRKLKN